MEGIGGASRRRRARIGRLPRPLEDGAAVVAGYIFVAVLSVAAAYTNLLISGTTASHLTGAEPLGGAFLID